MPLRLCENEIRLKKIKAVKKYLFCRGETGLKMRNAERGIEEDFCPYGQKSSVILNNGTSAKQHLYRYVFHVIWGDRFI